MSHQLSPGPAATAADLRAAQERDRLLRTELPRVRQASTAWRNGLGGLLAAMIGFSLIKGRSDVGELTDGWAAAVGVLLLGALLAGAAGALLLIRAANGSPFVASTRELPARGAADHIEALASASALRKGIVLTITCGSLLVAAVGTTWYGPDDQKPALKITTPAGTFCGTVESISHGRLVLKTSAGQVTADLATASVIQPVEKCPPD